MENPPYYVLSDAQRHRVEAWAINPVQYPPKGWQALLRAALNQELMQLNATGGEQLHATYATDSIEVFDVENRLFYNIGSACFAHSTQRQLILERGTMIDPCPVRLCSDPLHYYRYEIIADDGPLAHWEWTRPLAQWSQITIARLSSEKSWPEVWYGMVSKPVHILVPFTSLCPASLSVPVGLDLEVKQPSRSYSHIVSIIKSLIDGVIMAFHAHDGSDLVYISERVEPMIHVDAPEVAALLCRKGRAILGERRLIGRWGDSLKPNPGDDRCVAVRIRMDQYSGSTWSLAGTLYAVAARN